jgi:3'-phosphoadenosine 5'-phosphosulfate sulfotransferase (PAPS reductase)/FAD synthetase
MTTSERVEISDQELATLNERFESASPQEIIRWADSKFGSELVLMSSFGLEDVAEFDMFWRINPNARVMTLDTLRLPTETYTLMDRIQARYDVKIEAYTPAMDSVQEMVQTEGYNLFYKTIENRKLCCGVRKVEPLHRWRMDHRTPSRPGHGPWRNCDC